MKLATILLIYMPIINSVVDDALDVVDVDQLQTAIDEYKDLNEVSTDDAQMAVAIQFDEAFDFEQGLKDCGVPGDVIGTLLEAYDHQIFYWAIKAKVKDNSRKRGRFLRKFRDRVFHGIRNLIGQ